MGWMYKILAKILGPRYMETCNDGDAHDWIRLGYVNGNGIDECTKCKRMMKTLSMGNIRWNEKIYKNEREKYKQLVKEDNERKRQEEIERGEW